MSKRIVKEFQKLCETRHCACEDHGGVDFSKSADGWLLVRAFI
jgi:hypothetical protein